MVIIVLFWVGIHLIVKGGEKPGEMEASRFRGFFVFSLGAATRKSQLLYYF